MAQVHNALDDRTLAQAKLTRSHPFLVVAKLKAKSGLHENHSVYYAVYCLFC